MTAGAEDRRIMQLCVPSEEELGPEAPLRPIGDEAPPEPAGAEEVRKAGHTRVRSTLLVVSACIAASALACVYTGHPWATGPASSSVDDAVGLRHDVGLLHWKGYAHKCLDVEGGSTGTGTRVQLWKCATDNHNQRFIFPRTQGMIHWAAHPHLCLHVNGGNLEVGTHIVLDHCEKEHRAMHWTMPQGDGPIRLQYHPEFCIDEHDKHRASNGFNALLGHCPANDTDVGSDRVWQEVTHPARGQLHWKPHDMKSCLRARRPVVGEPLQTGDCNIRSMQTQFIFPGRFGVIRWAPYPHLCLHAVNGTGEVHLGHCRTKQKSMQWEVPNGAGPVRMLHERGRCLRAAELHGKVRTHACGSDVEAEMSVHWNFVTAPHNKWGSPSLFCWSIFRAGSYEEHILKELLARAPAIGQDLGIFDCDEFQLLSLRKRKVGWHHAHGWVHTHHFKNAPIGVTSDDTVGNTKLFAHAWAAVRHHGRYLHHAWTIKADPDCVVLPGRLRNTLRPHTGPPSFVVNCNAFPGTPNFPMIYGALEAYSKHALTNYFGRQGECWALPWQRWGEDKFMTKCMQHLGMNQVENYHLVGDRLCNKHVRCHDYRSAYHPLKSVDKWFTCYHNAMHHR